MLARCGDRDARRNVTRNAFGGYKYLRYTRYTHCQSTTMKRAMKKKMGLNNPKRSKLARRASEGASAQPGAVVAESPDQKLRRYSDAQSIAPILKAGQPPPRPQQIAVAIRAATALLRNKVAVLELDPNTGKTLTAACVASLVEHCSGAKKIFSIIVCPDPPSIAEIAANFGVESHLLSSFSPNRFANSTKITASSRRVMRLDHLVNFVKGVPIGGHKRRARGESQGGRAPPLIGPLLKSMRESLGSADVCELVLVIDEVDAALVPGMSSTSAAMFADTMKELARVCRQERVRPRVICMTGTFRDELVPTMQDVFVDFLGLERVTFDEADAVHERKRLATKVGMPEWQHVDLPVPRTAERMKMRDTLVAYQLKRTADTAMVTGETDKEVEEEARRIRNGNGAASAVDSVFRKSIVEQLTLNNPNEFNLVDYVRGDDMRVPVRRVGQDSERERLEYPVAVMTLPTTGMFDYASEVLANQATDPDTNGAFTFQNLKRTADGTPIGTAKIPKVLRFVSHLATSGPVVCTAHDSTKRSTNALSNNVCTAMMVCTSESDKVMATARKQFANRLQRDTKLEPGDRKPGRYKLVQFNFPWYREYREIATKKRNSANDMNRAKRAAGELPAAHPMHDRTQRLIRRIKRQNLHQVIADEMLPRVIANAVHYLHAMEDAVACLAAPDGCDESMAERFLRMVDVDSIFAADPSGPRRRSTEADLEAFVMTRVGLALRGDEDDDDDE